MGGAEGVVVRVGLWVGLTEGGAVDGLWVGL